VAADRAAGSITPVNTAWLRAKAGKTAGAKRTNAVVTGAAAEKKRMGAGAVTVAEATKAAAVAKAAGLTTPARIAWQPVKVGKPEDVKKTNGADAEATVMKKMRIAATAEADVAATKAGAKKAAGSGIPAATRRLRVEVGKPADARKKSAVETRAVVCRAMVVGMAAEAGSVTQKGTPAQVAKEATATADPSLHYSAYQVANRLYILF